MAKMCGATEAARKRMLTMQSSYTKNELCHLMYVGEAAFISENKSIDIPCRTILLLGEKDKVGKVAAYNKEWSRRTGFPLILIQGAAHNANDDQPEKSDSGDGIISAPDSIVVGDNSGKTTSRPGSSTGSSPLENLIAEITTEGIENRLSKNGDNWRLDCTTLLGDTLSFTVKTADKDNIDIYFGAGYLEMKRVN